MRQVNMYKAEVELKSYRLDRLGRSGSMIETSLTRL